MNIKLAALCILTTLNVVSASAGEKPSAQSVTKEAMTQPAVASEIAQAEIDKLAPQLWSSLKSTASAIDDALAASDGDKNIRLTQSRRSKLVSLRDRLNSAAKKDTLSREELGAIISDLEETQESVRNKRQMASTAFQNFDQKANQSYNLLSSVIKAMNEMRMGAVRNML